MPSGAAPLRVAGIGAGYFAGFHHDAWRRIADADLVAVADRDRARARATGLAAHDDVPAMLAETRPDIVDIVTPPETHLAFIRTALAARPRAVICQKPFCRTAAEAETAARLSAEAGVPVVVHENFRFQPWYRALRAALDAGRVGQVLQMTFRLRPGDGQGARAYLDRQPFFRDMPKFLVRETAIHWADTFRFLLGPPRAVFADLRRLNPAIAGEDAGHVLFAFDDGVRALFDGNRLLDHAAADMRRTMGEALVEGTAGTIALSGDGALRLRRFGAVESEEILPPDRNAGFGGDCVLALQSHVVAGLLTGAPLENTAADYLTVVALEEAIYRSARTGAWVAV